MVTMRQICTFTAEAYQLIVCCLRPIYTVNQKNSVSLYFFNSIVKPVYFKITFGTRTTR